MYSIIYEFLISDICYTEEIKTPIVPAVLVTKTVSTSTVPSSRAPPTPNREKPRPFTTKPTILTKPANDQVC